MSEEERTIEPHKHRAKHRKKFRENNFSSFFYLSPFSSLCPLWLCGSFFLSEIAGQIISEQKQEGDLFIITPPFFPSLLGVMRGRTKVPPVSLPCKPCASWLVSPEQIGFTALWPMLLYHKDETEDNADLAEADEPEV